MTTEAPLLHPELVAETLVIVPDQAKLDAAALLALVEQTAAIVLAEEVADDLSYAKAGESIVALKTVSKKLEALRTSMKAPALDAGRRIDAFFRSPSNVLEQAESTLKGRIVGYQREAERKRREADEAVRREREEAARLARVEAQRIAVEAAAKAKAERSAYDDLFGPEEPLVAVPVVEDEPIVAPTPVILPPAAPKLSGVSSKTVVKARVIDLAAVIKAAATGDSSAAVLLTIDQSALTLLIRRHGTALSIPGIETYEETVISARSA